VARVFVDTNVLFPFSVMDLLLALTEDSVHEVIWTEALLGEWERVIVREHKRTPDTAAAIKAAIRDFFAESEVGLAEYEHLVAEMVGKDPADREHMAAAIAGGAEVILTWNRRDFPATPLAARGVRVVDPDTYLCELVDQFPDEVAATVARLAAEKRRPPKPPEDLLTDLEQAGVSRFAQRVRSLL
jgi:predicted nucleic acid-binding protein